MSLNKETIERYMAGFRASDHALILSCLTDDVEWVMHGFFHHIGKEAFDREIENPAFSGSPAITLTRLTEEADVVVAEGIVEGKQADGTPFRASFCDVFEMQGGKIRRLTGYIAPLAQA
jgi:ketosteroid isomerase-like protein